MSGKTAKIKIGKFGQMIGFPGVGKGPQRNELLLLLGQAASYQPGEKAGVLVRTLNEALFALNGSGDRKTLISDAQKVISEAKVTLGELKTEKEEEERQRKAQLPGKSQLKDMKKLRTELTRALDEVLKAIDDDLGKIRLDPEMAPTALRAAGETIRREIGAGDPGEGGRAEDIREEIEALRERIDKANTKHANERSYLENNAKKGLERAEETLKAWDQQVGGEYKGPLRRTVEVLQSAMTGVPTDCTVIRALISEANKARSSARKDDGFVDGSHRQGVEEDNGRIMAERLESMLKDSLEDIQFLRSTEAQGYDRIQAQLDRLRLDAGKPAPSQGLNQATIDMRGKVSNLVTEIEKLRKATEQGIAQDAEAAHKALADAKRQYETEHRLHGDAKALESDWKAIEALIGSAEDILPLKGALPKGLTSRDVKLARSIAEQAQARARDIKDNFTELLTFDEDAKELAKNLGERSFWQRIKGAERGDLEKYDPKKRAELEKALKDLLAGLPTTPARQSMDAFGKLQEEAAKAVTELEPIVKYLEETAGPLYNEMKGQRILWVLGDNAATPPKAFDDALDALEAQVKLQPPVLDGLKAAVQTGTDELEKARKLSPEERIETMKSDIVAQAKLDKENKTKRSAESKLLAVLERKYESAELAVNAVKGDTNALAAAERLIDQIRSEIEANAFDRLESRRKDLEARLDLLLSNPRGEVNRHRGELPGVIKELRGAIAAAVEALEGVIADIGKHDTDDEDEAEGLEAAADLLRAYVELLESEVDDMASAAKPIMNDKTQDEDARRKAREEGLRILRSFRARMRAQPMTAELMKSPIPAAKGAVAPVFRALEKYEYTLTTCI